MELKDALVVVEKVMNIVATGQSYGEKRIRCHMCNKLNISEDELVEAWYKISRRDEEN